MLTFFRTSALPDYSELAVDFHSHLVPGVDDGSASLDDSLELLRGLAQLGYRRVITTPHVHPEYPNTIPEIEAGFQQLRQAAAEEGLELQLDVAAEYYLDFAFAKKLEEEQLLTFCDGRVLVEMSFLAAPPQLEEYLFRLQTKGYRPVLAHVERYLFLRSNSTQLQYLLRSNVELQCNINSLTGYYGADVQRFARELVRGGHIDFLCTDLHHDRHLQALRDGLSEGFLAKAIKSGQFKNRSLQ